LSESTLGVKLQGLGNEVMSLSVCHSRRARGLPTLVAL
jgi:hypothetical protein